MLKMPVAVTFTHVQDLIGRWRKQLNYRYVFAIFKFDCKSIDYLLLFMNTFNFWHRDEI